METKKTVKANLEPKKRRFFFIGFTIALACTLAAFEWGVPLEGTTGGDFVGDPISFCDDDLPPITIPAPPEEIPIDKTVIKASIDFTIVDEIIDKVAREEAPEFPTFEDDFGEGYFGEGGEKQVVEKSMIYDYVDLAPSFQCSSNSEVEIMKYFSQHVKYPRLAVENGIEGTVYVQFVVSKKGKLKDVELLSGVAGGCSEEALRVVKSMGKWCPGKNQGITVSVRYRVPIKFTLN